MVARVQVIVEAKDATSGILRGLTSQLGGLGSIIEDITTKNVAWGSVATQATQYVVDGVKESIKATREYAKEVRDLAMVSGTSAEEASRMLQVLDDFEIGAEDVNTAVRKMTQQGLVPNLETLAKLSDEYLSINDAQERNKFILDNLGRSGLQWVNVLNQGSSALNQLGDEVSESLILTQDNIDASEEYRLALDSWNDSVLALKVSIGNGLLPVLTAFIDDMTGNNTVREEANRLMEIGIAHNREEALTMAARNIELAASGDSWQRYAQAMDVATESSVDLEAEQKALAEQVKAVSEENKLLIDTLQNIEGPMEDYKNGLAEADQALADGKLTTEEHAAKVDELAAKYEDASNRIVLSIVEMKLAADGWTDAELTAYLKVGEKLGVFTEEERQAAVEAIAMADQMIAAAEPIYHVGERAVTASENFAEMKDAQAELAQGIRSDSMPAVAGLKTAINGLPVQTNLNIDVWIKTHGSVPSVVHGATPGTGPWNAQQWLAQQEGKQSGSAVYAGKPYLVGEAGAEPFFPSVNGRILGHAESLHAMTLAGGMGGGNTNYFYGAVTIASGGDNPGDIMSIR